MQNGIQMRYYLAIIKSGGALTAVVLRPGLLTPRLAAIFRREIDGPPQNALASLRKDCETAGYGGAWNNIALFSLGSENAVFHDFMLPTANKGMAKKTIPLLLESEFPFDPSGFELNTHFFRYGGKKKLGALLTLLPKKILSQWQSALEECSLPGARLFVSPWPLIACLRTRGKNTLLICFSGNKCAMAALDVSGSPMRVQTFSVDSSTDNLAEEARRKCGLLLSGLPFRPEALILAGEALPPGIEGSFEKVFEIPAMRARDNAGLKGNPDITGKSDFAWLQTVGMFRQSLAAKRRISFFTLRMKKNIGGKSGRWLLPVAACVLALCVAAGVASFLDSLEYRAKADILRAGMFEKLKSALPDAPRNSSMGKLRAILKSRLAESGANGEARPVVLEILENIHAAVPASFDIDVHRLAVDDKHARIYGHAGSYDDVNAMKEKLDGVKGIAGARIVNAANRSEKDKNNRSLVEFELDLAREAAP